MNRLVTSFLILTGLLLTSMAMAKPSLKVGDKAPAMQVAKWVKGAPVKKFENGKVYVVEFWATWCGPCRQSIPHLTELAKKYKDKVTFTGVSVFERPAGDLAKVADFVKEMGDKMDYNVAADDSSSVMGKTWMEAAEQGGIPTAFVIGKDTSIVWIGHPMIGLDDVLDKVVADKFDAKAYAEKQQKEKDEEQKMQQLLSKAGQLLQSGKTKEGIAELNAVLAAHPELEKRIGPTKFHLLLQNDEAAAYPYARKLSEGDFKDNAALLNDLAWSIADDKAKLKSPDLDLALRIAQRAAAVSKSADGMILDTLAFAYYRKGNLQKALETQEMAVKQLEKQPGIPEEIRKEVADRLEMFKKKKGGA